MTDEKRRAHRWPLDEDVCTYVEGGRLDLKSSNLSAAGIFIRTRREFPLGKLVCVVFRDQFEGDKSPVYLVGTVRRVQKDPTNGIGLEWVQAVTPAPAPQLARFLRAMLKVTSGRIKRKMAGRGTEQNSVFEFPKDAERGGAPSESSALPSDVSPDSEDFEGARTVPGDLDEVENPTIEVSPFDEADTGGIEVLHNLVGEAVVAGPLPVTDWEWEVRGETRFSADPGPITESVSRTDSMAICDLEGTLTVGDNQTSLRITYLGLHGMYIETNLGPINQRASLRVSAIIPTKLGGKKVVWLCKIIGIEAGEVSGKAGLDLQVEGYDEGLDPGILKRYVRWLQFNNITGK